MGSHHRVGIIVPVLDDATELRRLLSWWRTDCPEVPLWVVDGGSNDGSGKVARENGATVVASRNGRGTQMNVGARMANASGCNVFWFVHADALPPRGAVDRILAAVESGVVGGGFKKRFDHPSLFLRLTCWLADWRCRYRGWFLGDQGIFATSQVFAVIGGYPEWTWFEDFEFSRRMARCGRTAWIPATIRTSGRRFERLGAWKQTWLDFSAMRTYLRTGVPPQKIPVDTNSMNSEIIENSERPVSR